MKTRVQSIHFDADKKLLAFIEKKVEKLQQFYDNIISSEVYLRLQRTTDDANKITEIKLNLPGNMLFVKEQCKSFEEATDLALESLLRQIIRHKARTKNRVSSLNQTFSV
jgi:putative sigma-54 modulation protein